MPLIPFPNIPVALGVPNIPRSPDVPPTPTPSAQTTDTATQSGDGKQKWAILDAGGATVLLPDSVIAFEYKGESRVATYPVENGSFAAYNKIQVPYDIRVVFAWSGGKDLTREEALKQLEDMRASTDLFSIVTPDAVYSNANLVVFDYRRTSREGVTLLTVDAAFLEVRVSAVATYASTAQPSGASKVSQGGVAPTPPTTQQASSFNSAPVQ